MASLGGRRGGEQLAQAAIRPDLLRESGATRLLTPVAPTGVAGLEQIPEFVDGEPGLHDYSTHREGIYWVLARDYQIHLAVGHYYVAPLPFDPEPNLHEGSDGSLVVDPGTTGHLCGHLDLVQLDLESCALSVIQDFFLPQGDFVRNVIEVF